MRGCSRSYLPTSSDGWLSNTRRAATRLAMLHPRQVRFRPWNGVCAYASSRIEPERGVAEAIRTLPIPLRRTEVSGAAHKSPLESTAPDEAYAGHEHTYRAATLGGLVRHHAARHGWSSTARECGEVGLRVLTGLPWVLAGTRGSFALDGEVYPYLYHRRHPTWLNERTVEVPIARRMVERHRGTRILEVGNVLGLYGPREHLVVDKYERAPGVLNVDALDFRDERGYDLIVSVSTIEHIGWDSTLRS